MKRFILIIVLLFFTENLSFCNDSIEQTLVKVYANNNYFGLQTEKGENITEAEYTKLILLGEKGLWLAQKKNRYGIIDSKGSIVVPFNNIQAERIFAKYAKLKNRHGWGLFDENGCNIIPNKYSSIDPLFGKMFLTKRNYRYGIVNYEGKKLLNNDFEDIYMPNPKTLRLKKNGQWFEIVKVEDTNIELPENVKDFTVNNKRYTIKRIAGSASMASGYSLISTADYTLKIISSISPAYEETIDELMLEKGADAVSVITRFSWLPKFPIIYAKKYYQNLRDPYNGPLNNLKFKFRNKI